MDLTIVTLVEMFKRYVSRRDPSKKILEIALHTKYTDIELIYLIMCGGKKEEFRYRSNIKMGNSKKKMP